MFTDLDVDPGGMVVVVDECDVPGLYVKFIFSGTSRLTHRIARAQMLLRMVTHIHCVPRPRINTNSLHHLHPNYYDAWSLMAFVCSPYTRETGLNPYFGTGASDRR